MDFRGQAQKALEEARNAKVIGKSLEAHLTVYPNEVVKTLLEAVNSNVAQLLIVSELTIAEGPAPEAAVSFEDVAFTVERAAGDVCDLSLIHISEPTRQCCTSRMPSSA